MTFKGMLKILVNDYKKQQEQKMVSIVDELVRTRNELKEVKERLHNLQLTSPSSSEFHSEPVPVLSLFVQYNGLFNELCHIKQTMTITELLITLRAIIGIPLENPIHIRVLSEDGLTTLVFLHKNLDRTLDFYSGQLKSRMILRVEDADMPTNITRPPYLRSKSTTSSERTYSFESDV
ncbi:unnamed protein product [Adineta ricciae]|uniref:Uncharacterized protein n=1 Tax=Adineta ricciae TaxID=249248 RepID=A0A814EZM5_ADIRI|nr:unnamed protein product [Adineta ricciae]CAF1389931.1 unnamed protein product [Adineta ricciae]